MKLDQANRDHHVILPWCVVFLIYALFVPVALMGQDGRNDAGSEVRDKADEIRSSARSLLKLQRIPWITDPAEGFRLAKEENRPVFLYMQAGDPLEDC